MQDRPGARVQPLRPTDPTRLGPYVLLGRLGDGGMGTVYLADDDRGRRVAVKVIRADLAADDEFRRRFRSEVQRARQVPPFCTAEVLDADPDHEFPYLVIDYVDGPSLAEVVQQSGPLSPANLHGLAIGVATALTAIHGAGVVHRDLKPRNVLLALGSPKVIDFGIAHGMGPPGELTRTDQIVGTVAYMAPERFDTDQPQRLGPAADIFAWGAVIAYAGTGYTPFAADSALAMVARILTKPPQLDGLEPRLRELVSIALSKRQEDRPTARELLDLLLATPPPPDADLPAGLTGAPSPQRAYPVTSSSGAEYAGADHSYAEFAGASSSYAEFAGAGFLDTPFPGAGSESFNELRSMTIPTPQHSRRSRRRAPRALLASLGAVLAASAVGVSLVVNRAADGAPSVNTGAAAPVDLRTPPSLTPSRDPTPTDPTSADPTPTYPTPKEAAEPTASARADSASRRPVNFADGLDSDKFWPNRVDLDGSCQHQNGLMLVTLEAPGVQRCRGPKTVVAGDQRISVNIIRGRVGACASIWFLATDTGGYEFSACEDEFRINDRTETTVRRVGGVQLRDPIALGAPTSISMRLRGSTVEMSLSGKIVGRVKLPADAPVRRGGQVTVGTAGLATEGDPPYTAAFAGIEIRSQG